MVSISQFICISIHIFMMKLITSRQLYDGTTCTPDPQVRSYNYLCNSDKHPCQTFIVYRAMENFRTLSSISSLFNKSQTQLLNFNNLTEPTNLQPGREIIIPVECHCHGKFYQADFIYNSSGSEKFSTIACEVFEGLLTVQTLIEQNLDDFVIRVPVRCACPDSFDRTNGVKYLVTYPILETDNTTLIASKFGIDEEMIWDANSLDSDPTIFTKTTLLIPTKEIPVLEFETPLTVNPPPRFVIPLKKVVPGTSSKQRNSYIGLGVGVLTALLLLILVLGLFIYIRRKRHLQSFQALSARSSQLSSFSPDFLDGMSKLKHPLLNFSLEELRIATGDFCEASVIGTSVYQGRFGHTHFAIERMDSEETAHRVIDILTKINHLNIVKLEGCCDAIRPYLVFEFAANGCLRDCLSNAKMARELTWTRRMQIAFDIAVGLHYIHYCTSPYYVHRNINCRNVLITMDWRVKLSGFILAKPLTCCEEERENYSWSESEIEGREGYLAPEYLSHGLASLKMDIFAFGIVLLELISAKEAVMDGCMLKDCVQFLVDGGLEGSSRCLEKLKEFMDPALDGDYPLGDALCLAILAKGCVEKDPHHRPTMNSVLKALSRIA